MSFLILPLRRENLLLPSTHARLQHLAQVLLPYLCELCVPCETILVAITCAEDACTN